MSARIWNFLEDAARSHADRTAVVDGGFRLTYGDARAAAADLALRLREAGVAKGDRIAVLAPNSPGFFLAYFAAAGLGAILVPLNSRLADDELVEILTDAGARLLLAEAEFADRACELEAACAAVQRVEPLPAAGVGSPAARSAELDPVAVAPDDVAHLYYTSGTTGRAKGVMLTHRNVCTHARAAIDELDLRADDRWGHIAPMFHLADAWATFAITAVGGTHVTLRRFTPDDALALLETEAITITNLVPTMLNLMVKTIGAGDRHYQLRLMLSGGAPIAPEVVRAVMTTFGCDYAQTYGMTETSPYLTLSLLDEHLRTLPSEQQLALKCRTGRPFSGIELAVVDDHGQPVPADDRAVGEIRVRGPTVTPGYWNQPAVTAESFRDGWLCTGDLATVNENGYVNIVDRKKDVILSGGETIYSIEVENALYLHPAVLEAAVYGSPDPTWGEFVIAAVVLRPDKHCDGAELQEFCRARLAGYKSPKQIRFLSELPKTGSGKISKRRLRDSKGA